MSVTVGSRLREERLRLKLSQPDFAAVAGAKQGAQLKWEKDQSSPSANALAAWAKAGADVFYIITGRRPETLGKRTQADNVEKRLDEIEYALEWADVRETEAMRGVVRNNLHSELTEIATSDAYDVLETYRQRADDILRNHFQDEAAAQRRHARFAERNTLSEKAEQDVLDVLSGLSVGLDASVERELIILLLNYRISVNDLVPLVSAMKRAKSKNGVIWQERQAKE